MSACRRLIRHGAARQPHAGLGRRRGYVPQDVLDDPGDLLRPGLVEVDVGAALGVAHPRVLAHVVDVAGGPSSPSSKSSMANRGAMFATVMSSAL